SNCHLAPAALASTLRQVGEFWHGRSEWQAAADAFADALAIEPENGHFANLLGSCRLELGELDAAAAAFERAIARDQPLAHTNLAICEFRRGDLAAAARHFERAAELEPASAVANRNLEHFRSLQAAASAGA
ncbi:MAG: tetratricopeptide repeat protein, partial [Planctomycetes bacterium]|nr:tetratricopeptide repeat protein [Planctomycetota bacterium]